MTDKKAVFFHYTIQPDIQYNMLWDIVQEKEGGNNNGES